MLAEDIQIEEVALRHTLHLQGQVEPCLVIPLEVVETACVCGLFFQFVLSRLRVLWVLPKFSHFSSKTQYFPISSSLVVLMSDHPWDWVSFAFFA